MSTLFDDGYALLIAVNENNVADWALPDVAKDVAALQTVLAHPTRCAYPPEHVRVIQGPEATRQGILDGLEWLAQQIAADQSGNTTAIIYYTGHGWREGNATPPDYYFVPFDIQQTRRRATALRAVDFAEAVAALKPRRLLVMLDCCHAGGMGVKELELSAPAFTLAAPEPVLFTEDWSGAKSLDDRGLAQLQSGQGRAVLVSSQDTQQSYVSADHTMSLFTYHLIEALTGHAKPAGGANEVLASDILSHVYRTVPASALAQGKVQQPDGRLEGNFPVALLLGGKGLTKGEAAPDPLAPLTSVPASSASTLVFHNEGMQAKKVIQGERVYDRSAHAEGGGSAMVYNTGGGDFMGRDKMTNGIDPGSLTELFAPLYETVAASQIASTQKAEAFQTVAELQQELAKGKKSDDNRVARLVDGLVDLVPGAVGAITTAFASPLLAGVVGPVTKFVLEKIRGKA